MALNVQVYYGAWRGVEVAVKVMSADITQQVAAGLEVGHHVCLRLGNSSAVLRRLMSAHSL